LQYLIKEKYKKLKLTRYCLAKEDLRRKRKLSPDVKCSKGEKLFKVQQYQNEEKQIWAN